MEDWNLGMEIERQHDNEQRTYIRNLSIFAIISDSQGRSQFRFLPAFPGSRFYPNPTYAFHLHRNKMSISGAFFGGLSGISSLDTDTDFSDAASVQTHAELYERLKGLEDIASNFLMDRPIVLNSEHDSFTEIERNRCQEFDLRIPTEFTQDSVLAICVSCLPDYINDEATHKISGSNCYESNQILPNLGISLKESSQSVSGKICYEPSYFNGEYTYVLTTAHGINCDTSYTLSVWRINDDSNFIDDKVYQPVRIGFKIYQSVRAVSLESARVTAGMVGLNEFVYYRCENRFIISK